MSSRVLIPINARHIGSAQPPRPWPSRADPRGLFIGAMSRVNAHHPLTLLSFAFGTCPPQSSLRSCSGLPCGRPRPLPGARLRPALSKEAGLVNESDPLPLDVIAETVPASSACAARQDHFAFGSLRRLPIHAHVADSCRFAASRRPAGIASPGSARVADLPALFHAGSSMGTLPSEVSPRSSPPDPLGSCRPPCRFPPCGAAAPRI